MENLIKGYSADVLDPETILLDRVSQHNTGLLKGDKIPVLDSEGNLLVIGNCYTLRGELTKLEKAKFSCDNVLDPNHWIWLLVAITLRTKRVLVEVSYKNCKSKHQSNFVPVASQ